LLNCLRGSLGMPIVCHLSMPVVTEVCSRWLRSAYMVMMLLRHVRVKPKVFSTWLKCALGEYEVAKVCFR
jgi:hypothetical protein